MSLILDKKTLKIARDFLDHLEDIITTESQIPTNDIIENLHIPTHIIDNSDEELAIKYANLTAIFPPNNDIVNNLNELVVPNKKLESKSTKKQTRKLYTLKEVVKVWELSYKSEGFEAKCAICRNNIMQLANRQTWHMAHILSKSNNGSPEISNIRAICSECNISMGEEHMVDYINRRYPDDAVSILQQLKPEYTFK